MPLQQISLDQSIYKKKDTNINRQQPSQQRSSSGSNGVGHLTAAGMTEDSFTERQKALWAEQDKKTKEEREASMNSAQEIGMRVRAGLEREKASAQQQQQSVQKQQAEMKAKVEANPEPYAEEQWKFFLSLDKEGQKRFTDQIFAPAPVGQSTINGQPVPNAKTKYAGGAIADYWIDKGYVMFDQKGNVTVNKPEEKFEKGTFKTVAHDGNLYSYNTATGEEDLAVKGSDIPTGITQKKLMDVFKEARQFVTGLYDPSTIEKITPEGIQSFQDNANKAYKAQVASLLKNVYNVTLEEATKIVNGLPTEDFYGGGKETGGDMGIAYKIVDHFKGQGKSIGDLSQEEIDYNIKTYGAATWALVEERLGGGGQQTGTGQQVIGGQQTKKPYVETNDLEDYSTEGIINRLKGGIISSKDIPASKWKEISKSIDAWMDKTFSKKLFKENPEAKRRMEEYKKELANMQPGSVPELFKNIDAWMKKVSSTKLFKENTKAEENLKKFKEELSKIGEKGQPDWSKNIDDWIKKISSTKILSKE